MTNNWARRGWRQGSAALLVSTVLITSACSSSKSSSTASGGAASSDAKSSLPAEIDVASIRGASGATGFAGASANKGTELAVQEINDQHYLGASTTLKVNEQDTTGAPQTAATMVSAAIADKSNAAIFGPALSNEAIATAPIAQKSKMPIVFTQSGSDGVVIGDYTFRATAPMASYYPALAGAFLQGKNVKTVGLLYTTATPTLSQLGTVTYPAMASKYGFSITSSTAVQGTTTDFSAPISKLIQGKPDAVAILLVGAANPAAMTALRQAGYTGPVLANASAGAGNLKPAGTAGANVFWPTDFNNTETAAGAQTFIKAYQAKFNELPLNYAAEAYDAAWWLARAIKKEGKADRTSIQAGLAAIAKDGFEGAQGKVTFDGNDMRVPGVLVQWNGTAEILVSGGE